MSRIPTPATIDAAPAASRPLLEGDAISTAGPAEGFCHGCVEVGDELLDLGAQRVFAGEVAATKKLRSADRGARQAGDAVADR